MVKIQLNYVAYFIFFVLVLFNFSYYLNQYFVQQNYFNASEWQYGYEIAVRRVEQISNKYDKIVVSNEAPMDQSYMFFLFYLKYPPRQYQVETKGVSGGFRENHVFGKYEFRPIKWDTDKKNGRTLYVGRPSDFSSSKSIYEVQYPNGLTAIKLVE